MSERRPDSHALRRLPDAQLESLYARKLDDEGIDKIIADLELSGGDESVNVKPEELQDPERWDGQE